MVLVMVVWAASGAIVKTVVFSYGSSKNSWTVPDLAPELFAIFNVRVTGPQVVVASRDQLTELTLTLRSIFWVCGTNDVGPATCAKWPDR